jgi:diguanylate cyclase (GGDEF)-like protein
MINENNSQSGKYIFPFLSPAQKRPRNLEILVICALFLCYFGFHAYFSETIRSGIIWLALIPIIITGYFLGKNAGFFGALALFLIEFFSAFLNRNAAHYSTQEWAHLLLGGLLLIVTGALLGHLSDSRKRLSFELAKRKQNERQLQLQKDEIQEILDLQPDIICRLDNELKIDYINQAGARFFNIPETNSSALDILELIPKNEKAYFQKFIELEQKNEPSKQANVDVLPLYDSLGNKHYFQWSSVKIEKIPAGKIGYQIVGRDVSEQYQSKFSESENLVVAESLKTIASILNSTLDIQDVLNRVLKNIGRVVPHDSANIMLVEGQHAKIVQMVGYEKFVTNLAEFKEIEFPLELVSLHEMADKHQSILIPDTDEYPTWVKLEQNRWIKSYLGAPLIFKDELIGFLNLDSTKKHFFNETHANWLKAFADQAVIAIKNARFYEDANKRAFQLSKLNDIMRISIRAKSIEELIDLVSPIFREVFCSHIPQVYLWNEDEQTFSTQPSALEQPGLAQSEGLLAQIHQLALAVLHSGEIFCSDPRIGETPDKTGLKMEPVDQHFVVIPLSVDSRNLGVILLRYDQDCSFSQNDLNLMQQFAYQLSLAISKVQLTTLESKRSSELTHTIELLEIFTQVSNVIEMKFEMNDLFQSLGNELHNHHMESMITLKQNGGDLKVTYHSVTRNEANLPPELLEKALERFNSFANRNQRFQNVVQRKELFVFSDLESIIRDVFVNLSAEEKAVLISSGHLNEKTQGFTLPLINNENIIGTISIWGDYLQPYDVSSATLFADQVANAIEKARLYLQISQLAITDPLTGFYNRRGLEELGKHEIERSLQFNRNLGALMIDIDHFKNINDRYGHMIGDEVLIQLADCMRDKLRDADILCRYGGEEFFILLPEVDAKEAVNIAERLRNFISGHDFLTVSGPINATISIGISQLAKVVGTLDKMIFESDQALYIAKKSGRNSIRHQEYESIQ